MQTARRATPETECRKIVSLAANTINFPLSSLNYPPRARYEPKISAFRLDTGATRDRQISVVIKRTFILRGCARNACERARASTDSRLFAHSGFVSFLPMVIN